MHLKMHLKVHKWGPLSGVMLTLNITPLPCCFNKPYNMYNYYNYIIRYF